jgi:hypothetical protein
MCSNACSIILIAPVSLGARPAPPVEVAPEAIVKKNLGIDSNIFTPCLSHIIMSYIKFIFFSFLSGARLALSMLVAPEAMVGFLGDGHSLRSFFSFILSTLLCMCDVIDMVTCCDDLTKC